jgi:hypothetical protein
MLHLRFWVDASNGEHELARVARTAGHRRVHDAAAAEFFVVESDGLVDTAGALVKAGVPGDVIGGRAPRYEFQLLASPGHRPGIGHFSSAIQIVDGNGRVTSMGYGDGLDAVLDSFTDFLLHVGEGSVADVAGSDDPAIPAAVEEFLTLWTIVVDDLPLDDDTRRVADALVAMVGEVVKTGDPPRGVLRSALSWFAAKLHRFADEFAGAAGKALGVTVGVGTGAAVAGRLPQLAAAIDKALDLLG